MSDAKNSTTSAYYAGSSYQQGSNSAVVAQDQAYAERLQQQEFGNAQQAIPAATGRPVRPGTQFVAIYPEPTPFDPASLGVAGGFIAPHEIRIMDAFNLGKTVRFLAVLDGALLLLNCAYVPVLFLLLLWGPVSGWMAGTRFSTAWTYAYCCYYIMRLTINIAYIFDGYLLFILVFALNLVIARYLLQFAKILNSLSPAEVEQLRSSPSAWSGGQYRREQHGQPFQAL